MILHNVLFGLMVVTGLVIISYIGFLVYGFMPKLLNLIFELLLERMGL